MTQNYQQTQTELEGHLSEQIQFMKQSAESYDKGFEGEAKRLATCIRVLVHDTSRSKSLLGQMGAKDRYYWDSRAAIDKGLFPESDSCFVFVEITTSGPKYVPVLERGPIPVFQSDFDTWWNGVVFIDGKGQKTSRSNLVLAVANQDGGAHVDPTLDTKYADLSRNNSLGWSDISAAEKRPLQRGELAAVRQIAHEVLKTLDPDYAPVIEPLTGTCVGFMNPDIPGLTLEVVTQGGRARLERKGVGRNDSCPCGSGK